LDGTLLGKLEGVNDAFRATEAGEVIRSVIA
jgi:Zn-dependent alcohol dehydrogenase